MRSGSGGRSEKEEAPEAVEGSAGLAIGSSSTNRWEIHPFSEAILCDVEPMVKAGGGECLPADRRVEAPAPAHAPLGYNAHKSADRLALPSVSYYSHGVQTYAPADFKGNGGRGGKRGKITDFSLPSRKRLRETLLTLTGHPGQVPFSFTGTIPGGVISEKQYRGLHKRFKDRLEKMGADLIWRIELQQRGQPHLHGLGYAYQHGPDRLHLSDVQEAWEDAVRSLGPGSMPRKLDDGREVVFEYGNPMQIAGAADHCVEIEWNTGECLSNWFRYCADHASKGKQAQLGWVGRQWGVINRKAFLRASSRVQPLFWCQWHPMMRMIHRLTRSSARRGAAGRSTWFTQPDTWARVQHWARAEHPCQDQEADIQREFDRRGERLIRILDSRKRRKSRAEARAAARKAAKEMRRSGSISGLPA